MATIDEVRIQSQLISSLQIDPTTSYMWATEQIENIASEHFLAGKLTTETFTTTAEFEEITPSRKIIKIDYVTDIDNKLTITDYEVDRNIITISVPGNYKVRYYSYPDTPETSSDEIDMPTPYVNPLKFYLAGRIRARLFGQADTNAISFMTEFTNAMATADKIMQRKDSRHRRMPPGRRDI